jgi:hypothetical protein
MAGFQVNYEALDACARTTGAQAAGLGGAGDGFAGPPPSSAIFGDTGATAALAAAVGAVHGTVSEQLQGARSLLGDVTAAIGQISRNVRNADDAGTVDV